MQIIRSPRVYDVCIIGSGAAGGTAAKVLTEGGLEVVMLEAGPALDPGKDFKEHLWPYELTHRLPASAGMTAPGSARLSQMTPPPSCPLPLCPKNKCGKITHNHFLSHDPFFFESTLGHDSSSAPGRGVLNGEVTFHVDYSSGAVKPRLQKNQQRHLSAVKAHPEVKAQGIPRNRKGIT